MDFESLKSFCILIGYPQNNFLVYSNLLDAHPDIAINHHCSCLELMHRYRASSKEVLSSLLCRSRDYLVNGEKNYIYKVPEWFQKKCNEKKVEVIGDCFAERNLNFVRTTGTDSLHRLQSTTGVAVRIVHIVRNPFDNITDIAEHKYHGDIGRAIEEYFELVHAVGTLEIQSWCQILDIRHEVFMKDPMVSLMTICDFLGIKVSNYFLECCAKEVFKVPENLLTREALPWNKEQIDKVTSLCENHDFLKNYRYERK
jgi:hypothetical protein